MGQSQPEPSATDTSLLVKKIYLTDPSNFLSAKLVYLPHDLCEVFEYCLTQSSYQRFVDDLLSDREIELSKQQINSVARSTAYLVQNRSEIELVLNLRSKNICQ